MPDQAPGAVLDDVAACRSCERPGLRPFLSLGKTPLANALIPPDRLGADEPAFPLDVGFCTHCSLVQILETVPADVIFNKDYPYYSSFSEELLLHSREHVQQLIAERQLGPQNLVVEIASNDGYLLTNVVEAGVKALGIEPTPGPAAEARAAGVPTLEEFFGLELAERLTSEDVRADVIVANNVMAHVPELNDFVAGMALLLADDGVITVENPWVRELVDRLAFDTVYHEHFCYFSCTAVDILVRRHGLFLNHVEYFPDLHAGTLRWHLGKSDSPSPAVGRFLASERDDGVTSFDYYRGFAHRVEAAREELVSFLVDLKEQGATIAAYGAAAKGATLLNFTGLDSSVIDFVVDRNPHKQGRFMGGARLPILPTEALVERAPDYTLILAWNFATEIAAQQLEYTDAGGRFVVPLPQPRLLT
jgi:SAM-dependent methyltransferase